MAEGDPAAGDFAGAGLAAAACVFAGAFAGAAAAGAGNDTGAGEGEGADDVPGTGAAAGEVRGVQPETIARGCAAMKSA